PARRHLAGCGRASSGGGVRGVADRRSTGAACASQVGRAVAGDDHVLFVGSHAGAHRGKISMSEKREPGFDRTLALVLRIGAFAGFFVMVAGVIAAMVVDGTMSARLELSGVLVMLFTP